MTVRPLDFGDPFPSDNGDVPPVRPTSSYVERDYLVNGYRGPIKVTPPRRAAADLRVEPKEKPHRTVYQGVIVKREKENIYTVLRQDGKRVTGYVDGDDCVYDALKVGNDVSLVEGQKPGFWQITGAPRRKEMECIRVTNGAVETSTMAVQIPFTRHKEVTGDPVDPYFELNLNNGTIKVIKDITGEVELSITAYLTSTEKSTSSKVKVQVLTNVRYSNDDLYIEFQVTEIELRADQVSEPFWLQKLALDSCPTGVY